MERPFFGAFYLFLKRHPGGYMKLMHSVNPYATPKSEVSEQDIPMVEDSFELNLFSPEGRIGRVRYISYGIGFSILLYAVLGLGILASAAVPDVPAVLMVGVTAIAYLVFIYAQIMLTIKRCHDFNRSAWLALLMIVPLLNLMFLFIPGTKGENRFGWQPAPNSTLNVVVACILPAIAVIGVVAAIALPAYQSYVQRANAAAQSAAPR
jgi:uncharacterized membrane protein YhaH (DUF805 family)